GHPDRIRPSSEAGPRAGDLSRRAYRLLRRIQSPQRSRKQRQQTFDRRGKAYGLSLVAPNTRFFRKLAGNVGESAASVRLISDKVNKCCRSSLERRINPKAAIRRSGWADRARRPEIDAICAAAIALFQHLA